MVEKNITTEQQKRANFALDRIGKQMVNGKLPKDLSQFIIGVPNMILSNGLGQTVAFILSKKDKTERKITYEIIRDYMKDKNAKLKSAADDFNFIKELNNLSQSEYFNMQQEVLRMLLRPPLLLPQKPESLMNTYRLKNRYRFLRRLHQK